MKNSKVLLFAIVAILLVAHVSRAGDVVYTIWEDDGGSFWVRIQNDTERSIRVDSIFIVFYNEHGKPVGEKPFPCKGNCQLAPHDTRDFGAYAAPDGTESARVRNVKYSVQ